MKSDVGTPPESIIKALSSRSETNVARAVDGLLKWSDSGTDKALHRRSAQLMRGVICSLREALPNTAPELIGSICAHLFDLERRVNRWTESAMTIAGVRSLGTVLIVMALGGFLFSAHVAKAQDSCSGNNQAPKVLKAVGKDSGGFPVSTELRLTPAGDLIDDLIFLETNGNPQPGNRVPPFCFYRITVPGYVLKNDVIKSSIVQTDYASSWIVGPPPYGDWPQLGGEICPRDERQGE